MLTLGTRDLRVQERRAVMYMPWIFHFLRLRFRNIIYRWHGLLYSSNLVSHERAQVLYQHMLLTYFPTRLSRLVSLVGTLMTPEA